MSTGPTFEPQTRQVTVPLSVASAWTPQEALKILCYILTTLLAGLANYQISSVTGGHPLPVTPVPATTSVPNVPVNPAPAYVTTDDLKKSQADLEERLVKRIEDLFK